jgi:membrane fusion protein, heavy metal efflux system
MANDDGGSTVKWLRVLVLASGCAQAPTAQVSLPEQWEPIALVPSSSGAEVAARVVAMPGSFAVVTPPFRAQVVKVRVRTGDRVATNAPVLDVVMPEVLDAAARFDGASAKLQAWTERLAQLTQLRQDGLAKAMDVSDAAARVAEARAERQIARATLKAASVREDEVAALLASGTWPLRAPLEGVVVEIEAVLGSAHEPAAGPLLRISAAGAVRVEARSPRPWAPGDWALVTAGARHPLTLVSSAPSADQRDGTFVAWFDGVDLPAAGTLGRVVRAADASAPAEFRVPAQAIVKTEAQRPSLVTRRGPVEIEVKSCATNDCVVRGDLRDGDAVRLGAAR